MAAPSKPVPEAASPPAVVDAGPPAKPHVEVDKLIGELEKLEGKTLDERVRALSTDELVALAKLGAARDRGPRDPCSWASRAADQLSTRGDSSFLPRRGASTKSDAQAIGRALCMIAQEEPKIVRDYLRDYLPKQGDVELSYELCENEDKKYPDGGMITRKLSRKKLIGDELLGLGELEGFRCTPKSGVDPSLEKTISLEPGGFVCSGDRMPWTTHVVLNPAPDGTLYIAEITASRFTGCD